MRQISRKNAHGFTMVELLTVIAVIGILAGLLLAAVMTAKGGATRKTAQAFIMSISSHLEAYETEYGELPPGEGGTDSAESLYKALTRDDGALEPFALKKEQIIDSDGDGEYEVSDIWGTPLSYYKIYEDPEGKIRNRHIIFSAGPNREHEEGGIDVDDIDTWTK